MIVKLKYKEDIDKDGFNNSQTIITDEKGNIIDGVDCVSLSHLAGETPIVNLNLICIEYEFKGKAEFLATAPNTPSPKPVKSITFEDGTSWSAE